ncbi:RNA polymerase sigma factor [Nakamurella sp.]|uniref:RNA polymerase sigma factor n=1 Tax=Nakamurella sp. TaxID=1869182 RepID=UPI003B3AC432
MTDGPSAGRGAVDTAVTALARGEGTRMVAVLARRFGDLDLADEAVQDALVEALNSWPATGIPANPPGWLRTVATRRAIDRIRRAGTAHRRTLAMAPDLVPGPAVDPDVDPNGGEPALMIDDSEIRDQQLRLILLCCHPALHPDAQVALTLRLVGGLTTTEIAAAFLQPEATVAQRIVRAKRKIRDARIPLRLPADPSERIGVVLTVLYLVFNEGYLSRGGAPGPRAVLMDEAVRLTELVITLAPQDPEARGLLALELFHRARTAARFDPAGDLVLLDDQDRSAWDLAMIVRANRVLGTALARRRPGVFQLQALIMAQHANARTAGETDWPAIATLYGQLAAMTGSPVVELNHAVAVGLADGPEAGLRRLAGIEGLSGYHLLPAARAELLLRAGRPVQAAAEFDRALQLAPGEPERRHLQRRRASAGPAGPAGSPARPDQSTGSGSGTAPGSASMRNGALGALIDATTAGRSPTGIATGPVPAGTSPNACSSRILSKTSTLSSACVSSSSVASSARSPIGSGGSTARSWPRSLHSVTKTGSVAA